MIAQRILSGFGCSEYKHFVELTVCYTFRVSVSNDPELEVEWELVLEDSFEIEGVDVSTEIINFQLDSFVNEKRYIKGSMKTFARAANLFISFRHMSALLALETMYLQLWS